MGEKIGAPSVKGIKEAVIGALIGAAGGALYGISTAIFGNGLLGALAGIAVAGSMIKGTRGEIISTVLGFQIGQSLFSGGSGNNSAPAQSTHVMV